MRTYELLDDQFSIGHITLPFLKTAARLALHFFFFSFHFYSFCYFVFSANTSFAEQIGCKNCPVYAQIRVSNKGLAKIIEKSLDTNTAQIEKQIIQLGTLKNQKAHFKLPEYDKETGAFFFKSKNEIPAEFNFESGKIENIDLQLRKPIKCEKQKCHIAIEVKDLKVNGSINAKDTSTHKTIIPSTGAHLSLNKSSPPVVYEFDIDINPSTRLLEDVSSVGKDSVQIHIPENALQFSLDEKRFPSEEAQRLAELDVLYEKTQATIQKYKNSEILNDDIRVARAHKYFELTSAENKKPRTQGLAINPIVTKKNLEKLEKASDAAYSETELKKAVDTTRLPNTTNSKTKEDLLKKLPSSFFQLPEMQNAIELTEPTAQARLNKFPDTGSYIVTKSGEYLIQKSLQNQMLLDAVQTRIGNSLDDIRKEINNELHRLPEYTSQISELPKVNPQVLSDLGNSKEKIFKLEQAIQKEHRQGKITVLTEELEREKIKYQKANEALSKDENWMKLKNKVLIEKIENANHAVKLSLYPEQTDCIPQALPANENDKASDYDVATELSVDGVNQYIHNLHKAGDLNFCTEPLVDGKCKDGHFMKFPEQPILVFDPASGKHKMKMKLDVDKFGNVKSEFDVKVYACGPSPCLEITNPKAKSSNFILKLAGAGYLMEDALKASNANLQNPDIMSVPIADVQSVNIDKSTGSIDLRWNIK